MKSRRLKRSRPLAGGVLGGGLAVLLFLVLAAAAYAVDLLIVTQRETSIRKEKKLLGPKVATVREGDQVTKLGEDGSWYQVEWKGAEGWLPRSAVSSDKKVVLSGEAIAGGVRATEQSAGARGFNPKVEAEYRGTRPNLDGAYRFLDRIEKQKFAEDVVARFLREGKLGEQVAGPVPAGEPAGAERTAQDRRARGQATPPWKS